MRKCWKETEIWEPKARHINKKRARSLHQPEKDCQQNTSTFLMAKDVRSSRRTRFQLFRPQSWLLADMKITSRSSGKLRHFMRSWGCVPTKRKPVKPCLNLTARAYEKSIFRKAVRSSLSLSLSLSVSYIYVDKYIRIYILLLYVYMYMHSHINVQTKLSIHTLYTCIC